VAALREESGAGSATTHGRDRRRHRRLDRRRRAGRRHVVPGDGDPRPGHAAGVGAGHRETGTPVGVDDCDESDLRHPNGTYTLDETVVPVRRQTATGWAPAVQAAAAVTPAIDAHPFQTGWTEVYKDFPGQAYWNGAGDDPGHAKVGLAYDYSVTVRSYFQFGLGGLAGKHIDSVEVDFTRTTRPPAPGSRSTSSGPTRSTDDHMERAAHLAGHHRSFNVAYGYTGCPAKLHRRQCPGRGQQRPVHRYGRGHLRLVATGRDRDERPPRMKKFDPARPHGGHVRLVAGRAGQPLRRVPEQRRRQRRLPGQPNEPYLGTATPTLHATVSDVDGGLTAANFEWYVRSGNRVGGILTPMAAAGSAFNADIPAGAFADGSKLSWRVRGYNGISYGPWSAFCDVTIDRTAPGVAPTVSSSFYVPVTPGDPGAQASGGVGETGSFTLAPTGGGRGRIPVRGGQPADNVRGGAARRDRDGGVTPPVDGPQDLFVQSVDRAATSVDRRLSLPGGPGTPATGVWHVDGFGLSTAVPAPRATITTAR